MDYELRIMEEYQRKGLDPEEILQFNTTTICIG